MNMQLRNESSMPAHWQLLSEPSLMGSLVQVEMKGGHIVNGPLRGIRHIKHGNSALAVTTIEWGVRIDPEKGERPVPHPEWHFICPDLVVPQKNEESGRFFFYVNCCRLVTIDPSPSGRAKLLPLEKCRRDPNDGLGPLFEAMANIRYVLYGRDDTGENELAEVVRETAKTHDIGIRSDYLEAILAA